MGYLGFISLTPTGTALFRGLYKSFPFYPVTFHLLLMPTRGGYLGSYQSCDPSEKP